MTLISRRRALLAVGGLAGVAALTRGRWGGSTGLVMPGDDAAALIEFSAVETPSGESGVRSWEAKFAGPTGVAHFDVRMELRPPSPGEQLAFTRGSLRGREDSRAGDLLAALAIAHKRVRRSTTVARVDVVTFETAILGLNLSRGSGREVFAGEFTSNPPGPWIVVKVFLPAEGAEMYIALNPSANIGLFIPKDPEYWRDLEPVLASVL